MHLNDVFPPTNTLSIRYRYPSCVSCISIVIANDCEIVSTCTYKRFGGARLHGCGVPSPPRRSSGCTQVGRRRRGRCGLVVACRWGAAAHMSMGGIAKAVYWKHTLSRPHSSLSPCIPSFSSFLSLLLTVTLTI